MSLRKPEARCGMLNARQGHALRICVLLAKAGEGFVSSEEMAKSVGLSSHAVRVVCRELKGRGVLASCLGSRGGYRLAKPARETSVAEAVFGCGPREYVGVGSELEVVEAAMARLMSSMTLDRVAVAGDRLAGIVGRPAGREGL